MEEHLSETTRVLSSEDDAPATARYYLVTGPGTEFQRLLGDLSLQEAITDLLCQAAYLSGVLFGDNITDALVTSEEGMLSLAFDARTLGECIQVMHGRTHTTKLHRLMCHLADEMLARGNLWEGDASLNEMLLKTS